jgi:hypothetical protein
VLDLKQFQDGWSAEKSSWVCISENKSVQKRVWLVCGLVYDPRGLSGVTTVRPGVAGVLQLPPALDDVAAGPGRAGLVLARAGRYRPHYRLPLGLVGDSDMAARDWSV